MSAEHSHQPNLPDATEPSQLPPPSLKDVAVDSRYPVDAFHFVRRGLDYTVSLCHDEAEQMSEMERHVSGRQLCEGLRDYAVDQYGRLARLVLRRWRINDTADFGRIVFAMVNAGLMQATDDDSIRDFEGGYDFDDAFMVSIPVDHIPLDDPQYAVQSAGQ